MRRAWLFAVLWGISLGVFAWSVATTTKAAPPASTGAWSEIDPYPGAAEYTRCYSWRQTSVVCIPRD